MADIHLSKKVQWKWSTSICQKRYSENGRHPSVEKRYNENGRLPSVRPTATGPQKYKNEQISVGHFCGKRAMGAKKMEILENFSVGRCFFVAFPLVATKKDTDLRNSSRLSKHRTKPAFEDEMYPRRIKQQPMVAVAAADEHYENDCIRPVHYLTDHPCVDGIDDRWRKHTRRRDRGCGGRRSKPRLSSGLLYPASLWRCGLVWLMALLIIVAMIATR